MNFINSVKKTDMWRKIINFLAVSRRGISKGSHFNFASRCEEYNLRDPSASLGISSTR